MASKHYYLFGLRVWSVVVEVPEISDDEIEESDEPAESYSLSAGITLAGDDRPAFGFTPWTPEPWGDWEE